MLNSKLWCFLFAFVLLSVHVEGQTTSGAPSGPTLDQPPDGRVIGQNATEIRVPRMLRVNGSLKGLNGSIETSTQAITFALYKDQAGGTALWSETQNVQVGAAGAYAALLGAGDPDGLPLDLFSAAEARWLGVRINGQEEQPRIMFVSVPYALKAADAENLGGRPASAYLTAPLAPQGQPSSGNQLGAQSGAAVTTKPIRQGTVAGLVEAAPVNGSGTQNFVTKFTDNIGDIGNSSIFDDGNNVGIGTSTPASKLSVLVNSAATGYGGFDNGHQGIVLNNGNNTLGSPVGIEFGTWHGPGGGDFTFGGLYGVGTSLSNLTQGDLTFALRKNSSDTFFTEALRIQGTTGNIGIGTSSPRSPQVGPATALDVNGQVITPRLTLAQDLSTTTPTWHLDNSGSNQVLRIFSQPNINTPGSIAITAYNTTQVMIGNTAAIPTDQLDVSGNIGVIGSGNGIRFPDGSLQRTATLIGPQGPKGDPGPQGLKGDPGMQGPPGPVPSTLSATCFQVQSGFARSCTCTKVIQEIKLAASDNGSCSVKFSPNDPNPACSATSSNAGFGVSGTCCVCSN